MYEWNAVKTPPKDNYPNAWTRHDAQAIAYRARFGL